MSCLIEPQLSDSLDSFLQLDTKEDMTKAVIKKLSNMNIDIKNCRGQAYDNALNMSGMYNGLQSQIKQYSFNAEFIPCSAHSLNWSGRMQPNVLLKKQLFFIRLR